MGKYLDDKKKDVREQLLFTPDDVCNIIDDVNKHPDVETIKVVLAKAREIESEMYAYDYRLTDDDLAKKIEHFMSSNS